MIWCIEDDSSIRDIEVYTLVSTGLEAKGLPDGASFLSDLAIEKPELVILDIMLPGEDGISILKKMKTNTDTRDIPVILATAKGMEYDKVQGLDTGADDYLVKPFGMMEMVARVKAVLRRCAPTHNVLRVKGIIMNIDERTVTVDSKKVALTYKEFELLKLLMSHPGVAYTRDTIFDIIWGMEYVGGTRTVDMHIRYLRQKLCPYGDMIETLRNVGYRMEKSYDK